MQYNSSRKYNCSWLVYRDFSSHHSRWSILLFMSWKVSGFGFSPLQRPTCLQLFLPVYFGIIFCILSLSLFISSGHQEFSWLSSDFYLGMKFFHKNICNPWCLSLPFAQFPLVDGAGSKPSKFYWIYQLQNILTNHTSFLSQTLLNLKQRFTVTNC